MARLNRWECVTDWLYPPFYDYPITVVTKHWWRWSARLYRLAVIVPVGPRPIGTAAMCIVRPTKPSQPEAREHE